MERSRDYEGDSIASPVMFSLKPHYLFNKTLHIHLKYIIRYIFDVSHLSVMHSIAIIYCTAELFFLNLIDPWNADG